jgi:hypothetical protein
MSQVALRDKSGRSLELTSFDGKMFELLADHSLAPGQPMALELAVGIGHRLELKSLGSRKLADGRFAIRARATTLTSGAREALLAVMSARSQGTPDSAP